MYINWNKDCNEIIVLTQTWPLINKIQNTTYLDDTLSFSVARFAVHIDAIGPMCGTGNSKQCHEGATFRVWVLDVLSSRLNLCRLLGHLRPKCGDGVTACSRSQKRSISSTAKKERKLFGFLPRAVCLRVFHNTIRAMRQAQEMIRRERDIYIWNDEWRRSRASRRLLREITTTLYYRFVRNWTRKIFEILLGLAALILERSSYFGVLYWLKLRVSTSTRSCIVHSILSSYFYQFLIVIFISILRYAKVSD